MVNSFNNLKILLDFLKEYKAEKQFYNLQLDTVNFLIEVFTKGENINFIKKQKEALCIKKSM